ncbi:biotin/lipoyl-containing protein [Carboxydocella sp. ULO1]|uniref:biotin/lipoyl-containing protein n=1 Tax=Carboxydocella sp. ULO1 TaxID=1926599 RepID=UPI0009ABFAE9|nr:biotin/lipoyl-containing protein [Carboxydocella sp. ULO1]GAW28689.1 acetyl-CoA carboxylase biotin carboxyl carrier protein subunit [Carboxydocella sp. ULO1]
MKKLRITINGIAYEVLVEELPTEAGAQTPATIQRSAQPAATPPPPAMAAPAAAPVATGKGQVTAPMPGVIKGVKVKPGDKVDAGQVLVILEAMKMENEIAAKQAGTVKEVLVSEGQNVGMNEVLVVIE